MRVLEPRLIKHQLFTSDVDVESWLKFLNYDCPRTKVVELIFSHHPKQSCHISVKAVEYRSREFIF